MKNIKIKDSVKLTEFMIKPNIDKIEPKYCNSIYGCQYYDSNNGYNDICMLFNAELEFNNPKGAYVRCQQCLECFEVENV